MEDTTISKEEYNNIHKLHSTTDDLWQPNAYIYLRSNPENCFNRIKKRNRESEKNIKLDHIKRIHELHEINYQKALLNNKNIIVIDVENKNISDICSEIVSNNIYTEIVTQLYNY